MIGHRAIVGLSLLSTLLFCALAAQGAAAAEAKNTTAFTCVKGGGNKDFLDAHCDQTTTPGLGEFGHVPFSTITELHITNEKTAGQTTQPTPVTFKGTVFGSTVHIECTKVLTDPVDGSHIENTEEKPDNKKVHKVHGTTALIFEGCTVIKPANCALPKITVSSEFVGVEELPPEKKGMGLEFKPDKEGAGKEENEIFSEFTLEGAKCALKEQPIRVIGSAIATGAPGPTARESGATLIFNNAEEMQKLEIKGSGKPAEFIASLTVNRVKDEVTENPITLTTTT